MITRIALTAIFIVLVINGAFATDDFVIEPGAATADCQSPVIGDADGTENKDTVNYLAGWANKTYTVSFDNNSGTGEQSTSSCVYYDSDELSELEEAETDPTPCDLTYKKTGGVYGITNDNNILLGWTENSNGGGKNFGLSNEYPLTGLEAATLGDEDNTALTLYADWGECTYNTDNTDPANTAVAIDVDNNLCKYTISCTNGYEITSNPCANTTTWDASIFTCTNTAGTLNTTISACTPKAHTITYNCGSVDSVAASGSVANATQNINFDAQVELINDISGTGNDATVADCSFNNYHADHWNCVYDNEDNSPVGSTYNQDVNAICSLEWDANTYVLTLHPNYTGAPNNTNLYYKYNTGWYEDSAATAGTEITQYEIPTRTGYAFRGYFAATQNDVETNDPENAEAQPILERKTAHNTTVNSDDSESLPTDSGYVFLADEDISVIIEADSDVYAAWAKMCDDPATLAHNNVASCTLQIGTGGGVTYESECMTGYHALGSASVSAQPNGTAHPVCVSNNISLTWDKNTGGENDNMTITEGPDKNDVCLYGAAADQTGHIVVPQPTRDGYIFNGWKIKISSAVEPDDSDDTDEDNDDDSGEPDDSDDTDEDNDDDSGEPDNTNTGNGD